MRISHKALLYVLLFLMDADSGFAQHTLYWQYRHRLNYFVMPGSEPGQSQLANIRNRCADDPDRGIYRTDGIVFGQTYTRCGFYTALLATEYYLLQASRAYVDAEKTLIELNLALDAFERTDACETGPPWFLDENRLDGFFIRTDMPAVFSPEMAAWFNGGLFPELTIQQRINDRELGLPAWVNPSKIECNRQYDSLGGYYRVNWQSDKFSEADYTSRNEAYMRYWTIQTFTSQDEVLGALIGLILTIRLVDDPATQFKAAEIALRMIAFLADCPNCQAQTRQAWFPCFPDSSKMGNINGGDARAFAYPMVKMARFIGLLVPELCKSNEMKRILSVDDKRAIFSSTLYSTRFLSNRSNRYLSCISLALSNCRATNESTVHALQRVSSYNDWDTFYLLLLSAIYPEARDEVVAVFNYQKLIHQLNSAPINGPYSYNHAFSGAEGWSADLKWTNTIAIQNGNEVNTNAWSMGNFSGIDFMLLHNLAMVVFPDSFSIIMDGKP